MYIVSCWLSSFVKSTIYADTSSCSFSERYLIITFVIHSYIDLCIAICRLLQRNEIRMIRGMTWLARCQQYFPLSRSDSYINTSNTPSSNIRTLQSLSLSLFGNIPAATGRGKFCKDCTRIYALFAYFTDVLHQYFIHRLPSYQTFEWLYSTITTSIQIVYSQCSVLYQVYRSLYSMLNWSLLKLITAMQWFNGTRFMRL